MKLTKVNVKAKVDIEIDKLHLFVIINTAEPLSIYSEAESVLIFVILKAR